MAVASPDQHVAISPDLDYQPVNLRHGTKVFSQIYQQTGGTVNSIPVAATAESIFELPAGTAFNLSESYVRCTLTPTASGAGNFNWVHELSHMVSEIHLYTRGGQFLCQLTQAEHYQVMTRGWQTSLTDFMGNDALDKYYPSRAAGTTADIGGRHAATVQSSAPFTEMNYFQVGGSNTATPVQSLNMRLGSFKDTVFAMNKSFMFPETLLLRIVWGPAQRFTFFGTSATVPATAAAAAVGPVAISNLALMLAIEKDMGVISDLSTIAASGFKIPIPYVYVRKQATTASTSQNWTVRITPDMGFGVKRSLASND